MVAVDKQFVEMVLGRSVMLVVDTTPVDKPVVNFAADTLVGQIVDTFVVLVAVDTFVALVVDKLLVV